MWKLLMNSLNNH